MEMNLTIAIMFVTLMAAITTSIIALLNYRIKKRMIQSRILDESTIEALNKLQYDFKVDTLKWGMILLFGGLGLVFLYFIPVKADSTLPYGIEIIFIAAGFFLYFITSDKIRK